MQLLTEPFNSFSVYFTIKSLKAFPYLHEPSDSFVQQHEAINQILIGVFPRAIRPLMYWRNSVISLSLMQRMFAGVCSQRYLFLSFILFSVVPLAIILGDEMYSS